jgi:enoyl-CoA hydratase/carnithine racemase
MLRFSRRALSGNLVQVSVAPVKAGGSGNIATITLSHAASRNAMTVGMGEEFQEAVARLKKDPALKAAVLTGANGFFSAGGDATFLRQRLVSTKEDNYVAMRAFYSRFLSIRDLGVPVVAAINGPAIGAGLCVALACDVRVVEANAKLAVNFVRIGIHPGMGATYTLPRLVGVSVASRLLLTGETILGSEAKALGIAAAAPEGEAATLVAAGEIAESLATASRVAVAETLRTLRGDPAELDRALEREARAQVVCYAEGRDLEEAMNALKEKRKPQFK